MKKSILSFIFVFFSFTFLLHAKTSALSIQIIQNNPGQDKIWSTSEYFEQSVINYYFDSGRIVSNSPIYIKTDDDDKNRKALRAALIENNDGGMDYLIRIELFFKNSKSVVPDIPKLGNLDKVEWIVYEVGTGVDVSSGSKKPSKVTSSNDNEIGIETFAYEVAKELTSSFDK